MRDITVVVNNIKTVIIWAKDHPKPALYATIGVIAALITIFRFLFWDIPKWWNELILRDSIYLTQFETGKKLIPLFDGLEVPPITPIKANESTTIRYALVQDNKNAPQITAVIVTLPDDVVVVSGAWEGLKWLRNNDRENRWGLSISPFEVLTKGSPYCLPALHVTFKRIGIIPFSYQINVNKMDPIQRSFTINTDRDYAKEIAGSPNYCANEVNACGDNTFKAVLFAHDDDGQSVSASSCLRTHPIESLPVDDYEQEIKNRSDAAVKRCTTFEEKVLALRRYVDTKMKFPEPRLKDGRNLEPDDIYPLNTLERLDSGLGGWCDQQAHVFIRLAEKQDIKTRMVYLIASTPEKHQHTIAEALAPDGRWIVISLDPIHGFEPFTKDGRIATREDMAIDKDILRKNSKVKEFAVKEPATWGNDKYLSMFTNPPLCTFSDEETINRFLRDKR